jgi:RNA polymerase sigma-70 factor (ECF subfamily)
MGSHRLAEALLGALPEPQANALPDPELDAALGEALRQGRARWPGVALDDTVFVRHLARHLPEGVNAASALPMVGDLLRDASTADLFLATACLHGDPGALRTLDVHVLTPTVAAVAHAYRTIDVDELTQVVRERVLVGKPGEEAKIASYAGRSPLSAWLHVVAVRAALTMLRRRKPSERIDNEDSDTAIADLVAEDLELGHVRSEYQSEFKASFHASLAELSAQDRAVLRMSVVDGLSIDDLGRLYRVHRATAARWLVRIRDELRDRTRAHLKASLRLGDSEVESLVGLLLSRLDVSLARVLDELGQAASGPQTADDTTGAAPDPKAHADVDSDAAGRTKSGRK